MPGETYDPKKNIVTFGVIPVDGFADGDAIVVERKGSGVDTEHGIGGEWAFKEDANNGGMIKLRLMATAISNRLLMLHYHAGNLPVPVMVTNLSTGEIEVGGKAKIKQPPSKSYSASVGVREWVLVVGELTPVS